MLAEALGQLVREWIERGDFDRLRCLELLIVKGWPNKDVAKHLGLTEQAVASYKFQTVGRLKEMARRGLESGTNRRLNKSRLEELSRHERPARADRRRNASRLSRRNIASRRIGPHRKSGAGFRRVARARLEDVRQDRTESTLHTLGAIWKRNRLSCAMRRQMGSYLLEALDPELAEYVRFHVEVVACPFCLANLADLRARNAEADSPVSRMRQSRFFQSSRHLLGNDL